jgi:hypothetical protein
MGLSIGYVGEKPVASSSSRLKGFLTRLLDEHSLIAFKESFDAYRAQVLDPSSAETRLSLRVVCQDALIDQVPAREAKIPLNEGLTLVYLGVNAPERILSSAECERLDALRRSASRSFGQDGRTDVEALVRRFQRALARGYSISIVAWPGERATLLKHHSREIASLLRRFGYDEDDVVEIVEDSANLIGIAQHRDNVVGVVVAETVDVVLRNTGNEMTLRLAELTDSSIDGAHTGSGLQVLTHAKLIERLVERETPLDIIFSESTYGGSLHNAATLGRTFAGRLPNHAIIEPEYPVADSSTPAYQSLEVTYLTLPNARAAVDALRQEGCL